MKKLKEELKYGKKGITLISLVVTIIVLLILAGVSIATLIGNNGILTRAQKAKNETEQAQKEEQNILNSYEDKINEYTGIDWDTALANAQKHPDQKTSTAIGVGTDGRPVNMDLWEYTKLDDGTYGLNTEGAFNNQEVGGDNETNISTMGYKGNFVDGKIEGTIPQYISIDDGESFQEVTSLYLTFYGCLDLIQAPNIPDTVTNMRGTFVGDTNLEVVPKISNNVTDMTSTFYECSNLQEIGNISSNVLTMSYTFYGCSDLKTIPNLPEGLSNMQATFSQCSNLIKVPSIPNTVTDMSGTFNGCINLEAIPNLPEQLTNMDTTFYGCTKITTIPNIPQKVTNMFNTFKNCTNLTTVSSIPESVTNMIGTFAYCTNLQGNIRIDANITGSMIEVIDGSYKDYLNIFQEACKNDGITLKVTGKCLVLQEIITETNNPNITLGV